MRQAWPGRGIFCLISSSHRRRIKVDAQYSNRWANFASCDQGSSCLDLPVGAVFWKGRSARQVLRWQGQGFVVCVPDYLGADCGCEGPNLLTIVVSRIMVHSTSSFWGDYGRISQAPDFRAFLAENYTQKTQRGYLCPTHIL